MEDRESAARLALIRFASGPTQAPVVAALQGLCSTEELEQSRRVLLGHLEREPLVVALDAVAQEACAAFGFLARSEARTAGVLVPFDVTGLERVRSKA